MHALILHKAAAQLVPALAIGKFHLDLHMPAILHQCPPESRGWTPKSTVAFKYNIGLRANFLFWTLNKT